MIKSNFEHIVGLNTIAGNGTHGGWDAADKQLSLIEEEFVKELVPAIKNRDVKGVRDGIADVLVTVYGLAWRMGIDADLDFLAVQESNMSKFDRTPADAERTRVKYLKLGVDTRCRMVEHADEVYYVTVSSRDQIGSDGKAYPEGKFLKSVNYKEPEFTELSTMAAATLDLDTALLNSLGRRTFGDDTGLIFGYLTDRYSQVIQNPLGSASGARITFTRAAKGAKPVDINVVYSLKPNFDGFAVQGIPRAERLARLFFRLATDMPGDQLIYIDKVTFWGMFDKVVTDYDSYTFTRHSEGGSIQTTVVQQSATSSRKVDA